jgi:hypothetical protein
MLSKTTRRLFVFSVIAFVLIGAVQGRDSFSRTDAAIAAHKYSLFRWEVDNFTDKWVRKFQDLLPWNAEASREIRIERAQEFFDLIAEIKELERRPESAESNRRISELQKRRIDMQPDVEETIESEISSILAEEGFSSRIGVIFPPVDTVFTESPAVLITSPRERIDQISSTLLKPGISGETRGKLEDLIFLEDGVSALIVSTGGVATYPSVVTASGNLRDVLAITAHEWLHHWFFFQPLGQHFWDSADMTTLNETAASIGGEIIGDRAFTAMTGEIVTRVPYREPTDPGAFDYNLAMRETRLTTETLLAEGKIEEAEAYMEERRKFIADKGIFIRKINQAFFAFYGSYAASAASVSPIGGQLDELRDQSRTLGEFLKIVGEFDQVEDLVDYLGTGELGH